MEYHQKGTVGRSRSPTLYLAPWYYRSLARAHRHEKETDPISLGVLASPVKNYFLKKIFFIMCKCVYLHVNAGTPGGQESMSEAGVRGMSAGFQTWSS